MGTFSVDFEVGDPRGERWERVEALVDTGASFTWVGSDVLERLGLEPAESWTFETADGRLLERGVVETQVRLDGRPGTSVVIFGDVGSKPLLGAFTLERFLLSPDPVNQRLVPVRGLLMPLR
jgi:clan AA aspartic protease